jgi:hypothetical protein
MKFDCSIGLYIFFCTWALNQYSTVVTLYAGTNPIHLASPDIAAIGRILQQNIFSALIVLA